MKMKLHFPAQSGYKVGESATCRCGKTIRYWRGSPLSTWMATDSGIYCTGKVAE